MAGRAGQGQHRAHARVLGGDLARGPAAEGVPGDADPPAVVGAAADGRARTHVVDALGRLQRDAVDVAVGVVRGDDDEARPGEPGAQPRAARRVAVVAVGEDDQRPGAARRRAATRRRGPAAAGRR